MVQPLLAFVGSSERGAAASFPRSLLVFASLFVAVSACGDGASSDGTGDPGGSSPAVVYSSAQQTGIATYYDANGDGSCSFGPSSDLDVAAFDLADFAKSASCGACLDVAGPNGTVTVRVVDSCPGCGDHHLDLSESAFAKIASVEAGRVDITYHFVPCDVRGNVSYRFKEGSSKYWTAIQLRNHRVPVAKVEYAKNGAYTNMPRSDYNYFIDAEGVGDQPNGLALRITSVDGQVFEDEVPGVENGQVVPGGAQFE